MKAVISLLAVCALALSFIAYKNMDPSYDLALNIEGQKYIVDHGLTHEDCAAAMMRNPTYICLVH